MKMAAGRKGEFKHTAIYLCNNGIRFMKGFHTSALYFSPLLQF